ncbi:pyridine nucleotide-disulfide oxidoreductase domain-containing protein 2 isoform X2 [Lingula anatina]|uniref:Pyridine nucleotide-disulfide oxidoreductase domain-containing protein 2 n=1 Tax=Lingula anatina TaxID=7574 RepID=A0A1S3I1B7_LINAN|nr:pyridine nucleotide-disulfide oxidoreductase domain-containing protein 2 isoform X2 [Lingula anatina]|eukprot:XP_013392053.1 pyridine nucleotide-disulfide oxidoreductase domain-containing protein 2 isoform X2 [Lingula anatina]
MMQLLLVQAAYLQKSGLNVCVLEKRHVIGGAAVTEEIIPGFKFSRASYVLSLLRPQIIQDLELKKHGLKVYLRDPNSYTPVLGATKDSSCRSLILGRDASANYRQIAQFSKKDADAYTRYEHQLSLMAAAIEPLLDSSPVDVKRFIEGSISDKMKCLPAIRAAVQAGKILGKEIPSFFEMLTAPAAKVLDRWFDCDPLKATLATDAVIGAWLSPHTPGSGYVLLHHVMGELEGIKGAWGYVEGGMGAVSQAIANAAVSYGASIFTEKPVARVMTSSSGETSGVCLQDGTELRARIVLSNATPKVTYLDLMEEDAVTEDFRKDISFIDYRSPVTKINVAVNKLPNFLADPNTNGTSPMPHHHGTIHLNSEHMDLIHQAFKDAESGSWSKRPVLEMTIPSSLDPTISPPGSHVVLLFTQYTPYHLAGGREWTQQDKQDYMDTVFDCIEEYAPGFRDSVVGVDILTPKDLEDTFGLTGGNIFHGAMSLNQFYIGRPLPACCGSRSPVKGLYLCGSGAHPGGGVMGSPGRLAAFSAMEDFKKK